MGEECLPVTALEVVDGERVVWGEGPNVCGDGVKCAMPSNAAVRIIRTWNNGVLLVGAGCRVYEVSIKECSVTRVDVGLEDWIMDIHIVDDGKYIVATAHGNIIVKDGPMNVHHKPPEYALFLSAHVLDEHTVCFGTILDGLWIYQFSLDGYKCVAKLRSHKGSIFGICSNEYYVFSCSDDRTVVVYNRSDFSTKSILRGHDARVWSVSCDESYLASGSEDGTVRLWSLESFMLLRTLTRHHGKHVWSVLVAGGHAYSGGGDGAVKKMPTKVQTGKRQKTDLGAFHVTPENGLFTLSPDGAIRKDGEAYYESGYLRKFAVFASSAELTVIGDLSGRLHLISQATGLVSIMSVSECKVMWVRVFDRVILCQDALLNITLLKLDRNCEPEMKAVNSFDVVITSVEKHSEDGYLLGTRTGDLLFLDAELSLVREVHVSSDSITGIHVNHQHVHVCTRSGQYGLIGPRGRVLSIEPASVISYEGFLILNNGLHLHGFHGKDWVLTNFATKEEVVRVGCGGGHRLWQVTRNNFVYLRDSRLCYSAPFPSPPQTVIKPGLHGLETRCIVTTDEGMCITGGEDGSLILSKGSQPIYRVHFGAGIKAIAECRQNAGFVICGIKELLAVVCIINDRQLGVLSVAKPVSDADGVRNMCLAVDKGCCFVGSSDGHIRKWNIVDSALRFDSIICRCDHCVMSICSVDDYVFAGTSSGQLVRIVNDNNEVLQPHQGAILSMACTRHNDILSLYTGGDDGWICALDVASMAILHKWQAHNSSITALLPAPSLLYSCSVDQTICTWSIPSHSLHSTTLIPLADAAAMTLGPSDGLLRAVGRGSVSLAVDCDGVPTCTARTGLPPAG